MNNKSKILISLAISAIITIFLGLVFFEIPERFFPADFKIMLILMSFVLTFMSFYIFLIYFDIFRESLSHDRSSGRKGSNILISFLFVIGIWGILFGLAVYDSPQNFQYYLLRYGPSLPFALIFWYAIISVIRKERFASKQPKLEKNDSQIVRSNNIDFQKINGVLITESGYPVRGYDLIFTDKSLIRVDAGGTLGSLHLSKPEQKAHKYLTTSPENILSSYNCNLTNYSDIKKANLKKYFLGYHYLYLETPKFKGKYIFKKDQYQKAEQLFNKFLDSKSY